MLKFGVVTNINEKTAKVRVRFAEDNLLSYWLPVIQAKTLKDKFYVLPDLGEHVVCLMDENLEDGVILGAIYSDADLVPVISKDKFKIKFNDSTEIEYDRVEHILNIICPNINIEGIINHTGLLLNSAGILSEGEIIDHTSSMQAIRGIYNSHTHNETDSVTQKPNQEMS
jgi:phage baseplate assembly protein V